MKSKKAISLIVLVITIIVMIILASAIIMSLDNVNIFNKAEEAVDKTSDKEVESMASLAWAEGYMEDLRGEELKQYVKDKLEKHGLNVDDYVLKVTDKEVIIRNKKRAWVYAKDESGKYTMVKRGTETLQIGDYINNYNATGTEYTGKWKVLGAGDDGSLLIISELVTEKVQLRGIDGLVNGISKLDAACGVYGNGYGAKKARNIRINEINKLTGYNPYNEGVYDPDCEGTGTVAGESSSFAIYGSEFSYYWRDDSSYFIDAVFEEKSATIQNGNSTTFYYYDGNKVHTYTRPKDISTESKRLIFKQKVNGYNYYLTSQGIEKGSKIFDLICISSELSNERAYWIAEVMNTYTTYLMRRVQAAQISSGSLLSVTGIETNQTNAGIRPVVELKSDIKLEGTSDTGWTII